MKISHLGISSACGLIVVVIMIRMPHVIAVALKVGVHATSLEPAAFGECSFHITPPRFPEIQ